MLSRTISLISVFWAFPYQHNGTYTRNVYPAIPTKKLALILRFAEGKKEPLSRKNLGKAARNALGKGTGPSNLLKPILASFCHASKNGCKKAQKSLKLLGFLHQHLCGCRLMVDLKRLELSTSRMRTERSPKRDGFSSLQTDKMFERCKSRPAFFVFDRDSCHSKIRCTF